MMTQFDRSLKLGYGFSIIILLIVSIASYLTLENLFKSNQAVEHSGQVMQKAEKLLSVMKDAETGERGYLLSGKANYLEPYNGAYKEAMQLATQLSDMTADNGKQQHNIQNVKRVLGQRLGILDKLVLKKQHGEKITDVDLDAGKAAMDELRRNISQTETDEQLLLNKLTARLTRYSKLVPGFILIAALIAMGISLLSYRTVIADYKEKELLRLGLESSEEEAQTLNEELTAANEEITASNEELEKINNDLLKARKDLASANELLEQKVIERTRALQESEEEAQALNEELSAVNEEMAATNEELLSTNEELALSEQRLKTLVVELKKSHELSAKLVAIVESSDDAIIGKDLDGNITSWNRGAEQIFGYTDEEVVGHSILKLIPEDLQHEEPLILARLRSGEKIDHYETIRRRKDGILINVSLTISPIRNKEGVVVGVSKIARDITVQKQDEQRKNDFIGMASHELKTPLTSLMALIQVLQQKLRNSAESFIPQALDKASLQTKKMSSLINGFLNVSRLESGKLEITPQVFDLPELILEQIDEIKLAVNSHTFNFNYPYAIKISADREKIGSVLSNLFSNAVKYSPKGNVVNIACLLREDEVLISVQDEGMGIEPQDLLQIFKRYYRVGSDRTRNISGFGIGLYLSSEIIERHQGRIWVESESGKGSTFNFSLPLIAS